MVRMSVKDCILINCTSFTVITIMLSVLSLISDKLTPQLDYFQINIQMFICTTLIAFIMYFVSRIPIESDLLSEFILLSIVGTVVLGLGGGVYKWFSWVWQDVLNVSINFIVVFIITKFVVFWQNKELSKKINKKIKEREENFNDEDR